VYPFGAPHQLFYQAQSSAPPWSNSYSRQYTYWPNGALRAMSSYDDLCGETVVRTFLNDHRGRTIAVVESPTSGGCGQARESLLFYNQQGQMIAARHTDSAANTTKNEVYFWLENEPVFRYVIDGSGVEQERTFFFNDQHGTPRLGVSIGWTLADTATTLGFPGVSYRAPAEPFMAGAPAYQATYSPVGLRFQGRWAAPIGFGADPYDQSVMLGERAYMPHTGAHASASPAFIAPPAEFYSAVQSLSYANNDPVQLSDPSGRGTVESHRAFDRSLSSLAGICPETDNGCLLEPWQQPEHQSLRAAPEQCTISSCRGLSATACEQCCGEVATLGLGDNPCFRRCLNACSRR
jgi:hypothetical protein